MSFQSRRELLGQVSGRYREEAYQKMKTTILNEFIASTGYARKYAIRLLNLPIIPAPGPILRPRTPWYGLEVQEALRYAWASANYISSKRLTPFLQELVPALERHGYLDLTERVRAQLLAISPATVDRLLRSHRSGKVFRGIGATKRGTLLKHQVPIRTFADWNETKPGFLEVDLVAHCGWSTEGAYLNTIVLTDIATGWVEFLALRNRSGAAVIHAFECARELIPFSIMGIDTDNGSEFLNSEVLGYVEREKITFTRGRAYRKNDQCFVEQKNGAVIRQLVGYDRFEGEKAYRQLTELYRAMRLYVNFFQPSMKLKTKERMGAKVRRTYDKAQTPFQRLCSWTMLDAEKAERFKAIYEALDPVKLLKQVQALQDALWKHAIHQSDRLSETVDSTLKPALHFQPMHCGLSGLASEGLRKDALKDAEEAKKRKYRRSKTSAKPHWWKTRKDPFEGIWEEICNRLTTDPQKTAKSLLQELQEIYPGKYNDNQLRTLQRRVKSWRTRTILAFDDQWLQEEILVTGSLPRELYAQVSS